MAWHQTATIAGQRDDNLLTNPYPPTFDEAPAESQDEWIDKARQRVQKGACKASEMDLQEDSGASNEASQEKALDRSIEACIPISACAMIASTGTGGEFVKVVLGIRGTSRASSTDLDAGYCTESV